ncbi:MAG TPA: site-specific DNA-methyltransferase [Aggregatilineales bacterium]|nr:site-specific DNA-methyltransferase [Anaerolineales bacterium]HRE46229.1 site-specific DNA-methyltransferase [Aggregatilineales bacterium]
MNAQTQQPFVNQIIAGDCLSIAKTLPTESVQCIVTSPPYFGHREYIKDRTDLRNDEIGREKSPLNYVGRLVTLFGELRRVLKDSGTIWLNLGDTYRDNQLLGIPWRVAFALQDDGWLLRSEIIWEKPNAMPSSVKNRPTTSHETIFLFAKKMLYTYYADAIREAHVTFSEQSKMKGGRNHFGKAEGTPEQGKNQGNANLHRGRWDQAFHPLGRNKRTVWSIPLGKFREAHFAVFPPDLVELCIRAGTKETDIVLDPFMGSGTTAVVARSLKRDFVGIELNPEYVAMAQRRLETVPSPLFA